MMNQENISFFYKTRNKLPIMALVLIILTGIHTLSAQNNLLPAFSDGGKHIGAKIFGYLDWSDGLVSATVNIDLGSTGIRLPAGRKIAEDLLEAEYWRLLRPYLFSIQADSSSTIYDLIKQGVISLEDFDRLEQDIKKIPPSFLSGFSTISGRYSINLYTIEKALYSGRSTISEPIMPLIPVPTADYTGIIIIADSTLPVHGRNISALLLPCLSPKIWDTDMNLIYERKFTLLPTVLQPNPFITYAKKEDIFRPVPSGLDKNLEEIVGLNPLRIIARKVFGIKPTDPVIDKEDALIILSSENNRRLLKESRIVLVLDGDAFLLQFK